MPSPTKANPRQSCRWSFSINYTDEAEKTLKNLSDQVKYMIFCRNEEEDTLQGLMIFQSNQSHRSLKQKPPLAHAQLSPTLISSSEAISKIKQNGNFVEYGSINCKIISEYDYLKNWISEQSEKPTISKIAYKFPKIFLNSDTKRLITFVNYIYEGQV